ncbi:MAG: FUSC family membrane protein [Bacteroidota bacterium]
MAVSTEQTKKRIQGFIYSQAFADGLRATFAILLPALIGLYAGYFQQGLTISLGAMCASLTDAPGPIIHKRTGIIICAAFAFVVAICTSYLQGSVTFMAAGILVISFFFSMLSVYGNRASAVGSAVILVMILTMDKPITQNQIIPNALLISGGCILYLGVSWFFYSLQPYRVAQRALGECLAEIAAYLKLRAAFYAEDVETESGYKKLVAQQIVVNEKQDTVREIFFKTRRIVEEKTEDGRRLVFTFVQTVDLFEHITAAYYNYELLRKKLGGSEALVLIHHSLMKIAGELENIGLSIQSGLSFNPTFDYDEEIKNLKAAIDDLATEGRPNALVLKKIIVNIRGLLAHSRNLRQYFEPNAPLKNSGMDHSKFVSHQPLNHVVFWNNLGLKSSVFRHSLRVCIACVTGFIIARLLQYGDYSYWILLTIAFILKPSFSLTKERNRQRILGTIVGGITGFVLLLLIPSANLLFVLMVIFMIGAYSFMRTNYLAMVMCITPYVMILLNFLGADDFGTVVTERLIDTAIGSVIAFLASHYLFPRWEGEQLASLMKSILQANAAYLEKLIEALQGKKVGELEYKLARKNVYLQSANLSTAFQRMLSEPKSKQTNVVQVQEFVVLNHILFSNVATVATGILSKDTKVYPEAWVFHTKAAHAKLEESILLFDEGVIPSEDTSNIEKWATESSEDELMKEQLNFIYKLSVDINKAAKNIMG